MTTPLPFEANPDLRALLIAAAGGHHLRLTGQHQPVRDQLAERLARMLPSLDTETRAQADRIAGHTPGRTAPLVTLRAQAGPGELLGHLIPRVRPGAASLAHGGLLYLERSHEAAAAVAHALIEVLENGAVVLGNPRRRVRFPARFLLLLGAPACPCAQVACTCPPHQRTAPWGPVPAMLQDRIDLKVPAPDRPEADWSQPTVYEKAQVVEARLRALARLRGTPFTLNGQVPADHRRRHWPALSDRAIEQLAQMHASGQLTARGVDRVLRTAWTIADLDGLDRPGPRQVTEAAAYRLGVAIPIS
jgi:magnesium chelatase family protein